MVECFWCDIEFDGTYYRYLCPSCGVKVNCCDGAPLPAKEGNACPPSL